jgi:ABC-type phosphate transport system permease subunit
MSIVARPPTPSPGKLRPDDKPDAPRQSRRRGGTSGFNLIAKGEPMIWLTGGGLAVALLMIMALLLLVFFQGVFTFWPGPLVHARVATGEFFMGEVSRGGAYTPREALLERLPPALATRAHFIVDDNGGISYRRLFRTGNFELTNEHFNWISDWQISPEGFTAFREDRKWVFRTDSPELARYRETGTMQGAVSRVVPNADGQPERVFAPDAATLDEYLRAEEVPEDARQPTSAELEAAAAAAAAEAAAAEPAVEDPAMVDAADTGMVDPAEDPSLGARIGEVELVEERIGFVSLPQQTLWVFRDGSPELAAFEAGEQPARPYQRISRGPSKVLVRAPDRATLDAFIYGTDAETRPKWAVLMERQTWGRFYGTPDFFVIRHDVEGGTLEAARQVATDLAANAEGEIRFLVGNAYLPADEVPDGASISHVAEYFAGSEAAWRQFERWHPEVRRRVAVRRSMEKHDTGRVSHRIESARLAMRQAQIRFERTEGRFGQDDPRTQAALQEARAAEAYAAQVTEEGGAEFTRIRNEINLLNQENARYQVHMQTADGREKMIVLDQVVRAYLPNQVGLLESIGIYVSRWREFLFADPREANMEGGVFPAIFGTVVMTLVMSIVVVPFGVLAALYLREYAKAGPVVSAVRIAVNNLAGVPSIVFGVFGLGFFAYIVGGYIDGGPRNPWPVWSWMIGLVILVAMVVLAGLGSWFAGARRFREYRTLQSLLGLAAVIVWLASVAVTFLVLATTPFFSGFFEAKLPSPTFGTGGLLWASMTLALLTLPVVIVATEEALAAVPSSMRDGSYACGASKWQTIRRIVLPRAMPGIMTGMILAMARGAGEVAPLMIVGAVKLAPELPIDGYFPFFHLERSFMHLGFHIYDLGFQSQNSEAAKPMVFTTTLLLIMIVATLNISAIWLRSRLRRKFVASHF